MTQPAPPARQSHRPPTRSRSTLLRWLILGVLAVSLAAIGYYFWQKNYTTTANASEKADKADGKNGNKNTPTTVTVTPSVRQDITLWQEMPATVTPLQQVIIRPTQAGQIRELYFQDGQMVKKGQLLAKLDDRLIVANLKQAQAIYTQTQAQLATAKLTQARYQSLLAQHAVSQQEIDQYTGQVNLIQAQQAAAQSQIQSAQVQLDNTLIKAPFAGQVGIHKVSAGAQITPTDTNGIVTLTQTQPIAVSFGVPDIVTNQQSAKGLPVQIWSFASNSQLLANSQISTVDAQIDTSTGSLPAQAIVANTKQQLSAGQSVKVKLVTQHFNQAITVPIQAVQKGLNGYFVLTTSANAPAARNAGITTDETADSIGQKVVMQPVKILGQNDQLAIIDGIEAGVNVIIDGAAKVREGSLVKTVFNTPTSNTPARNTPTSNTPARNTPASTSSTDPTPRPNTRTTSTTSAPTVTSQKEGQ